MDQNLKQRLVGAIVLISLAVLFLPLVFDGQQEAINIEHYALPAKPSIVIESPDITPIEEQAKSALQSIAEVEASKIDQVATGPGDQVDPQVAAGEPVAETTEPPQHDAEQVRAYVDAEKTQDKKVQQQAAEEPLQLADAWVIQVGAFSKQDNAIALRNRLNASGYKAYTKAASGLHKVYVGPEIRKYRLQQQKTRLEQEFAVNTMILKYIP